MTIVSQKSKQEIPAGQIESEVLLAEDTIVSVGNNKEFSGGVFERSLSQIYEIIKTGRLSTKQADRSFIEQMEKLAALKAEAVSTRDSKRYDAAKKGLPLFCWSGQFDKSKGVPSSTSLLKHSGRLQIDIDGLESPEEAANVRDKLGDSLHLETGFLSSGRYGVKAGLWIPPCKNDAEHKRCFAAAKRYFWETYQIKIDEACKDVSRKCFFSYDPDLWFHEDVEVLDVEYWQPQVLVPVSDLYAVSDQPTFLKERPSGFTKAQLKKSAKEWLEKAVKKILDAAEGERHKTIFGQSRLVGQFCPHTLERKMAENKLLDAALKVNPEEEEDCYRAVRDGLGKGMEDPRWPILGRADHSEDEEGNKQIQFLISKDGVLSDIDCTRAARAFLESCEGNLHCIKGAERQYSDYQSDLGIWRPLGEANLHTRINSFIRRYADLHGKNTVITSSTPKSVATALGDLHELGVNEADFKWNPQPTKLVCANGVLDLDTMQLGSFNREQYATLRCTVSYDPAATCHEWESFLAEALPAPDDRARLQEWFGYALWPEIKIEKALLMIGNGRNGKGVCLKFLQALFDPTSVGSYELADFNGEYYVAKLSELAINIATEANFDKVTVGKTKAIISGESVTGRHPTGRPFSFCPTAKHFISSNAWPKSNDRSEGYTRRWDVVLFENQLRDSGDAVDQYLKSREGLKDSDPELLNRLITNELPGFLNWCLVGLQRLRSQKWKLSDAPGFLKGAQKLRSAIDPLLQFIDEKCIWRPDWRVLDSKKGVRHLDGYWCRLDYYHSYFRHFCEDKRYPAKEWSEAKLRQELEQKGFAVKRSRIAVEKSDSGRTGNPQFWCVLGLKLKGYESVGNPIDDDDNEVSSM